jgi:hypothetical protein
LREEVVAGLNPASKKAVTCDFSEDGCWLVMAFLDYLFF